MSKQPLKRTGVKQLLGKPPQAPFIIQEGELPKKKSKLNELSETYWTESRCSCDNCKGVFYPRFDQVFVSGYSDVDYLGAWCPTKGCQTIVLVKSNPSEDEIRRFSKRRPHVW